MSAAATWVLGDRLSASGSLTLPVSLLGASGTVLVGLLSYLVLLWRRDLKRERIRFAKEMDRAVCGCTETGEVMLLDPHTGGLSRVYRCPLCPNFRVNMDEKRVTRNK